jgi:hypothetical protein
LRRRPTKTPWIIGGSIAAVVLVALAFLLPPQLRVRKARKDVQVLDLALNGFILENKQVPDGTLAEIAALLRGKSVRGQNTKRLDYVEADVSEVNAAGEFVDPWGTPYQMRFEKGIPRVFSCGPNRKDDNGTGDDITVR